MGYFESLERKVEGHYDPPQEVATSFSYEMDFVSLVDRLNKIDQMTDEELRKLIVDQYKVILNYDIFFNDPSHRMIAQKVFSNERFLRTMIAIIPMLNLNAHQQTCINKLTFDYKKMHGDTGTVFGLLLQLSTIANYRMVKRLAVVVDESIAKEIAMVRMSSFNEVKNVMRVHNLLVYNTEDITAQDVVNILTTLFERFTVVFITMMNIGSYKDTQHERNFNAISVALLALLDNMSSTEMKKLLISYGIDYFLNHNGEAPRFSLQNLGEKYHRINSIVKEAEQAEFDVIIP